MVITAIICAAVLILGLAGLFVILHDQQTKHRERILEKEIARDEEAAKFDFIKSALPTEQLPDAAKHMLGDGMMSPKVNQQARRTEYR